jgi:hypothetical protein
MIFWLVLKLEISYYRVIFSFEAGFSVLWRCLPIFSQILIGLYVGKVRPSTWGLNLN